LSILARRLCAHPGLPAAARPVDAAPAPLAVPVRRFDLDAEGRAVHELVEAAFSEIENNVARSHDTWYARRPRAPSPRSGSR